MKKAQCSEPLKASRRPEPQSIRRGGRALNAWLEAETIVMEEIHEAHQ